MSAAKKTVTLNIKISTHQRLKVVATLRGEDLGELGDRILIHYLNLEQKELDLKLAGPLKRLAKLTRSQIAPHVHAVTI